MRLFCTLAQEEFLDLAGRGLRQRAEHDGPRADAEKLPHRAGRFKARGRRHPLPSTLLARRGRHWINSHQAPAPPPPAQEAKDRLRQIVERFFFRRRGDPDRGGSNGSSRPTGGNVECPSVKMVPSGQCASCGEGVRSCCPVSTV
jgi:hypothetical protein